MGRSQEALESSQCLLSRRSSLAFAMELGIIHAVNLQAISSIAEMIGDSIREKGGGWTL